MKRIFIIAVLLVTAMSISSCGPATSGPGDPSLTYDLVAQNVNSYIGKRVRWRCMLSSLDYKDKIRRGIFIIKVELTHAEDVRTFVVNNFKKPGPEFFEGLNPEYFEWVSGRTSLWVTGTIAGTDTVNLSFTEVGIETQVSKAVPLLSHAEIEKDDSHSK